MGHLYVKENETFSTSRNGTVPKPTAADVSANKILQADGTWVDNSGSGGGALDDLSDVSISSPVAGHSLVYNEDDNEWQNTFLEEKMCLANVSGDVFIDNPAQGEVLTYNGSTWINAEPPSGGVDELTELTDVDIDTPLDGHVLAYDALSDKWKNAQPSGGADSLNDLTDVGITSVANGQILKYNSTTHKWENTNESGGTVTDVKVNGTSVVSSGEALIKSYKELTQAQYDALPSSKLTDGVLYCITDDGYVEGQKFAPVIYSTEERQIGTWIDGKPVYQRVIKLDDITTYSQWVDTGISIGDIDKFICGRALDKNDIIQTFPCIIGYITASTPYTIGYYLFSSSYPRIINYLILQYTKSTDIPGSGRWGTDGVPTHHYSTDEKIIGTWIDGKTVYEKVVTKTVSGAWPQVFTTLEYFPNLETCIKIEIIIHRSGGSFYTANGSSSAEYTEVPQYTQYKIAASMRDINTNPNLQYYVNGYTNTDVDKLYFIVQYTKSTD